jgi:hypothetical protein
MKELKLHELISVLILVNTVFFGDFQLKDKYWYQIIQILHRCSQELGRAEIEKIVKIPILEQVFSDISERTGQLSDDSQEVYYI